MTSHCREQICTFAPSFLIFVLMFRQIALADLIIINKTDLVSQEELNKIRTAVRYGVDGMNKLYQLTVFA